MSYQSLTKLQKRRLWSLVCLISQGMPLYEEDHEYDDEEVKVVETIEAILNTPKPLEEQ